jgi:hypothetical protein
MGSIGGMIHAYIYRESGPKLKMNLAPISSNLASVNLLLELFR